MENQTENRTTDYSSNAQQVIDSPEALEQYLKGSTTIEEIDQKEKEKNQNQNQNQQQQNQNQNQNQNQQQNNEGGDSTDKENEEGDETQYPSIIHYLNEDLKLNLNLSKLPENLTQDQEAEMISALLKRAEAGYRSQIVQYQHIDQVLKDAEVKAFIEAKQQGKTLKDYVSEFAQSPQGQSSEQVSTAYLKKLNPSMTDDDIKEMVTNFKEKGKLEKLEADARKYFQTQDTEEAKLKEQRSLQEAQENERKRIAEVQTFGKYISEQKDISGIPLDNNMKRDVYLAATQIVDETTRQTWLDQALQTDEGVFLAAMGILHMRKLLNGKQTNMVNRRNQSLVESIFETPDPLQSGSGTQGNRRSEVSEQIANAF